MKNRKHSPGDRYVRIGSKIYDTEELKVLYSGFAQEDRELANAGLEGYSKLLKMEDEKEDR